MKAFDSLLETVRKLRNECPWDRKQTHRSLRKYMLEEAYELIEAIEHDDAFKIKDETGDVLLQVMLHSVIAEQSGEFTVDEMLNNLDEKLKRRHPHVFSDAKAENEHDVLKNWVQIKKDEKKNRIMDDLPALPGLLLAAKVQKRASAAGFDWDSIEGVFDKIQEEITELRNAENDEEREKEMGDVLFAVTHLSNFLGIDPEIAIHRTIKKFSDRYNNIEEYQKKKGEKLTLPEMEKIWNESKKDY